MLAEVLHPWYEQTDRYLVKEPLTMTAITVTHLRNDAHPHTRVISPSILYFGTPVVLISTVDTDGKVNLSPMSSAWALGDRIVLGMGCMGQGCENLLRQREAVINIPSPAQCDAVEAIAATTGRNPVPPHKVAMGYRFDDDKFRTAGLTPAPSDLVAPPRIAECPLQLEARLLAAHRSAGIDDPKLAFMTLEMQVLRVHAHDAITHPGTNHIDTSHWSPLLYVFRHYFGTGRQCGRNFRAET
jgi:flavin reductase (DIM6/NTAB) family NADH-FMN oxidoreductase RutF